MERRRLENIFNYAITTQKKEDMNNEVVITINEEVPINLKCFFTEYNYDFGVMYSCIYVKDNLRDIMLLYEDIHEVEIAFK